MEEKIRSGGGGEEPDAGVGEVDRGEPGLGESFVEGDVGEDAVGGEGAEDGAGDGDVVGPGPGRRVLGGELKTADEPGELKGGGGGGELRVDADAGASRLKTGEGFGTRVADAGNEAQAGDLNFGF